MPVATVFLRTVRATASVIVGVRSTARDLRYVRTDLKLLDSLPACRNSTNLTWGKALKHGAGLPWGENCAVVARTSPQASGNRVAACGRLSSLGSTAWSRHAQTCRCKLQPALPPALRQIGGLFCAKMPSRSLLKYKSRRTCWPCAV